MHEAFIGCRAVHFASTMLAFGAGAFRLYAVEGSNSATVAVLDRLLRHLLLVAAIVALLSALGLVPFLGAQMAGSPAAALDRQTVSAVILQTSFRRIWRWHLLMILVLVIVSAIRRVRPGYRAILAALSLASLGWIGHVAIGEGEVGFARQINQSVHLLAGGIWLGGFLPLAVLSIKARAVSDGEWLALLRQAVPHFSQMGYVAVPLVAITGIVNTAVLVGSVNDLIDTPYGRLLLVKIALFLALIIIAAINRLVFAPLIGRETSPGPGTTALIWTVALEQLLALAIIAVVSSLGTLAPPLHVHGH